MAYLQLWAAHDRWVGLRHFADQKIGGLDHCVSRISAFEYGTAVIKSDDNFIIVDERLGICMLPIRLNSLGLMEETRLVPSASGLPVHCCGRNKAKATK